MQTISKQLSAVIFPFIFSACVSQSTIQDFNQQSAAKARVELALGYLQQNNPQLAKINLDKALQHDKNYYLVHSALAHYYQQQGEIENVHREYDIALKLNNQQGDLHNNFGTFLCRQKQFEQAMQQFQLALNSPNYVLITLKKWIFINKHYKNCDKQIVNERKNLIPLNKALPNQALDFKI